MRKKTKSVHKLLAGLLAVVLLIPAGISPVRATETMTATVTNVTTMNHEDETCGVFTLDNVIIVERCGNGSGNNHVRLLNVFVATDNYGRSISSLFMPIGGCNIAKGYEDYVSVLDPFSHPSATSPSVPFVNSIIYGSLWLS